jgi:hypothetical protein
LNLITCHLNKFITVALSIVTYVAAGSLGSCVDSGIVCEVLGARTESVSYVTFKFKFLGEACGLLLSFAVAQTVPRTLYASAAQAVLQVLSCGNFGRQISTGVGFIQIIYVNLIRMYFIP